MTAIDDRGQNRPKVDLSEGPIVNRLKCDVCNHVIIITAKYRRTLLKQLDPNFPAQTITLDCPKCKKFQFILRLKMVPRR
jgi:RNase P subunit RPR2